MKKRLQLFFAALIFSLLCFHAHAQIVIQQQSITVEDYSGNNKPEQLSPEGNMFVKAVTSKSSCVVNEPVLVTYKFYTRLNTQGRVTDMPTFTGCSVQEMTSENAFPTMEMLNGKPFRCYTIRKVQLYPLHAGDIVLGAASVENTLNVYNKGALEKKTFALSSPVAIIHVTNFPEQNKPANFDGAVGNFSIKAMVNKRNDTANENNSLQIIIEGEGSFQNVSCPVIVWPTNIENFEATTTDMVNKVSYPASGGKVFDIPFVPKAKGKFTIPSISFSFYDTETHTYKTVQTESITVNVAEAKPIAIDQTKIHEDITNTKYIWIVGAIALVAGISLWFRYGFEKKKSPKQMVHEADEMIEKEIETIKEKEALREDTNGEKLNKLLLCENDSSFFSQAKILCQELISKETDGTKISSLHLLVNDCNAALYAAGNVSKDDVLRRLEEIIL